MSGFHVGQLVLCVGNRPLPGITPGLKKYGYGSEVGPKAGVVYTVREFFHSREFDAPALLLIEIVNEERWYKTPLGSAKIEPHWFAINFRPLDDSKLEVFRKIAASPRQRIRVGEAAT